MDALKRLSESISTLGFNLPPFATTNSISTAPSAAVSGVAPGTLGSICESSINKSTNEVVPVATSPRSFDGYIERAILCEAALQTVEKLDLSSEEGTKIAHRMETTYFSLEPSLKLALRPSGVLESPSLESKIDETTTPKSPETASEINGQTAVENSEPITIGDQERFAQALINSSTTLKHGNEGSSEELSSHIMKALTSPSLLNPEGQATLSEIGDAVYGLEGSAVGGENLTTDTLFKRSIMGEVALQAILQSSAELEALPHSGVTFSDEGIMNMYKFARDHALWQIRKT